ncbi:MAG: hypothetical protein M1820_009464 [Bogoriella megaspora]|nr:MAG: hypothetical protein M1820_009464 [Bogoriella megaspora]
MNAIGRLQQSLAAATNDVTVAASNINFDFTLVKYEAPREYHPLGALLSTRRKHDAEFGPLHATARRLGALFEGVCPNTPKLVQAYGTRASEIARVANDKVSSLYADSIFAAHTGIDATSLWAAATSSKAALHVHLLASMLARQWKPEEATSICMELIKQRSLDIAEQLETGESMPFSLAAAAAQREIPRQQIAEWDASARAWLQTADTVKARHQTQMIQILKNISLPVNASHDVYISVVDAWISALDTVEKILCGMPQAVGNGACFLALASWHLYPDTTVFGEKTVEIEMADPLIPSGGVLSLGLTGHSSDAHGVRWSLSLAHLRYYGEPVRAQRSLNADFSRITMPQMFQVVLGCVFGRWSVPLESTREAAKFINSWMQLALTQMKPNLHRLEPLAFWLRTLESSTSDFLNCVGEEADTTRQLVLLGRRRAYKFIDDTFNYDEHEEPYGGLLQVDVLLQCLKNTASRLLLLRHLVARVPGIKSEDLIMRCVGNEHDATPTQNLKRKASQSLDELTRLSNDNEASNKRSNNTLSYHDLSLPDSQMSNQPGHVHGTDRRVFYASAFQSSTICQSFMQDGSYCDGESHWLRMQRSGPDPSQREIFPGWLEPHCCSETCHWIWIADDEFELDLYKGNFKPDWDRHSTLTEVKNFKIVMGDPKSVSIMVAEGEPRLKWHAMSPRLNISDLSWCIEHGLFHKEALIHKLLHESRVIFRTYLALFLASKIYNILHDATNSVGIFERPILGTKWAQEAFSIGNQLDSISSTSVDWADWAARDSSGHWVDISRGRAFSIVAYFESGALDIGPDVLKDVIALSSGDSLFIAMSLLCDPLQKTCDWELQRVLGNVGKPGITMLVPPQNPIIRKVDASKWKTCAAAFFDGQQENCFGRTQCSSWSGCLAGGSSGSQFWWIRMEA